MKSFFVAWLQKAGIKSRNTVLLWEGGKNLVYNIARGSNLIIPPSLGLIKVTGELKFIAADFGWERAYTLLWLDNLHLNFTWYSSAIGYIRSKIIKKKNISDTCIVLGHFEWDNWLLQGGKHHGLKLECFELSMWHKSWDVPNIFANMAAPLRTPSDMNLWCT